MNWELGGPQARGSADLLTKSGKTLESFLKMAENLVNLEYLRDYRLDLLKDLRDIHADFDITLFALERASSNLKHL